MAGGGGAGEEERNSRSERAKDAPLPFAVVFYTHTHSLTHSRICPVDRSELVLVTGRQVIIVFAPELGCSDWMESSGFPIPRTST